MSSVNLIKLCVCLLLTTTSANALSVDELCSTVNTGQQVHLKGLQRDHHGLVLVATIGDRNQGTHYSIPVMPDFVSGVCRVSNESQVMQLEMDSIDSATTLKRSKDFNIYFLGRQVMLQAVDSSSSSTEELKQSLLSQYKKSIARIKAAVGFDGDLLLLVETVDKTVDQLHIDPRNNIVKVYRDDTDSSNGITPSMLGLQTSIGEPTIHYLMACFLNKDDRGSDVCGTYVFMLDSVLPLTFNDNTYHANVKRFIGCPQTIDELCQDPQADAVLVNEFGLLLIQGRHTYQLLSNGVIDPPMKTESKFGTSYVDAAFLCEELTSYCVFTDDLVNCSGVTNEIQQAFPQFKSNRVDSAFCSGDDDIFITGGDLIYRYEKKGIQFAYRNSNPIREVFRGVPANIDAAYFMESNNRILFLKNDKYYETNLTSGSETVVKPIKNNLLDCGNYSLPSGGVPVIIDKPSEAKPSSNLFVYILPILIVFIIVVILIIVILLVQRKSKPGNTTADITDMNSLEGYSVNDAKANKNAVSTIGAPTINQEPSKTF